MTMNEYQEKAMSTCMLTSDNFSYMFLNLVGEVGEFASKVAKGIRKDIAYIGRKTDNKDAPHSNDLHFTEKGEIFYEPQFSQGLRKEAGDILWQLSGLCHVMGWTLEDVARENLDKLATRKANGTIDGNGDGVTKEERR